MNNIPEETPTYPLANLNLSSVDKNEQIVNPALVPPASNTMGNAKPLFDPAFEKMASTLAGSFEQAYSKEI
mgnify:CR=1 FL=1